MLGNISRRCLSTSSLKAAASVKPPVQVHGVEGRYASALYCAAHKSKKLEAVEKELAAVQNLYNSDTKFKDFVLNPTHKRLDKQAAIEAILKKLGQSEISVNLFSVMAENGRLPYLEGVVKSFDTIMRAHRGEVACEIVSAKPLDSATSKQLETVLQSFVKSGEKIQLSSRVDPSIVGGLIITIGDKYVDMSLASKITTYENLIRQAV